MILQSSLVTVSIWLKETTEERHSRKKRDLLRGLNSHLRHEGQLEWATLKDHMERMSKVEHIFFYLFFLFFSEERDDYLAKEHSGLKE